MLFPSNLLGRKKYWMQLHQQIGAETITRVGNISSTGMMIRNRFFLLFPLLIWSLQYHIRICGKKSTDTDKKCWIIFKLCVKDINILICLESPLLSQGDLNKKHRCRHSVFTYYTICFHRADNIIILHCAFKSSCQQGNHLSFKILNQIFNLVVCKASVPVCWITYVNISQIQTHFGYWKLINFIMASKRKGARFSEQTFQRGCACNWTLAWVLFSRIEKSKIQKIQLNEGRSAYFTIQKCHSEHLNPTSGQDNLEPIFKRLDRPLATFY